MFGPQTILDVTPPILPHIKMNVFYLELMPAFTIDLSH